MKGRPNSDYGLRVADGDSRQTPESSSGPGLLPEALAAPQEDARETPIRCFLPQDFERATGGPVEGNFTAAVTAPFGGRTAAVVCARVRHLIESGVSPYSVLVLVGNRGRRRSCLRELNRLGLLAGPGGAVEIQTYSGLANRTVGLFWPKLAPAAGFSREAGARLPVMLTFETAQYLMSQLIGPLLDRGYFEGLPVRRQRILSQLLDNLNKAAVNGYPMEEVGQRLQEAWAGEAGHQVYFQQAQECIDRFRAHCLEHGLVDFSLAVELFDRFFVRSGLGPHTEPLGRYRHLAVDQLEETVPVAQDLIEGLLANCDSSLLLCDDEGGYRVFMGVDPGGACRLASSAGLCMGPPPQPRPDAILQLGEAVCAELGAESRFSTPEAGEAVAGRIFTHYRSRMIEEVVEGISGLVKSGVNPGDIAAIAPHADGVLRFLMSEALAERGIPFVVVRRYGSLREEPEVRACLTLAALAHPEWECRPHPYDVAEAMAMVTGLDPVRAALAARHFFDPAAGRLRSAEGLAEEIVRRIGENRIEHWERVRRWLLANGDPDSGSIDHFFRKLFGEVLARDSMKAEEGALYARLINSATWFRQAVPSMGLDDRPEGRRYLDMLSEGIVSAEYQTGVEEIVSSGKVMLVAPVYTYLLHEQVSRYQFWLDVGSIFWWEPPHQPLTNPHVLSRSWTRGARWTEAEDRGRRNQLLQRLVRGLCRRCLDGIYLCASEVEAVGGGPQDSPLLRALEAALPEKDGVAVKTGEE